MRKSRSLYFLLGVALAGSVVLFVPHFAHASFASETVGAVFTTGFQFIAFIVNTILGFLFTLAAGLVQVAMDINLSVTDLNINTIVQIGWTICRDIANLGFVLATVIMAFMTIIRQEEYGARKLLVKLVTAAFLVNFSLTIGGVFIDFSNVLTNFFLSRISSTTSLPETLAIAFGPQKYFLGDTTDPLPPDPTTMPSVAQAFGWGTLLSISGLVFTIAFTLISTIVLLTFAFMLLVRYVYLTILLLSAPLSWLFTVVPGLGRYSDKWWSKFIQWTFFAPAMTFFVYLALAGAQKLSGFSVPANFFQDNTLAQIMAIGTRGIVLCVILVGGLITANSMGITGAGAGLGAAKGLWSGTKQYVGDRARAIGQGLARAEVRGTTAAGTAGAIGRGLRLAGSVPLIGIPFRGLARTAERARAGIERAATTPPVERTGIISSLTRGALVGGGLIAKRGPRKDEEKTKEELIEEREEMKRRLEKMEAGPSSPKESAPVTGAPAPAADLGGGI